MFLEQLEVMNGKDSSVWHDLITSDDPDILFKKFCRLFRSETRSRLTNEEIGDELEKMGVL